LQISRRTFLRSAGCAVGAAAVATSGIALYEPHRIEVERRELYLPRLPRALDGFRLAQISDIHFGHFSHENHLRNAVNLLNAEDPDLVVGTGDFVTVQGLLSGASAAERAWPCAEILSGIRATHGRFAVLGNHDLHANAREVSKALQTYGTPVLRNHAVAIEVNNSRLWLAVLDDALHGHPDVAKAVQKVPQGECVIAAVHEPDYADQVSKHAIDLQISGHTHGGQVRFPALGALYLPPLGRKYVMGSYRVRQTQVYTNRGFGVILLPIRFLCPPEITVFTLRAMTS
jgi:predicted MPP superfamily phosphohydrolase